MSEDTLANILLRLKLSVQHIPCCTESFVRLRPAYHNETHCFSTAITFFELGEGSGLSPKQLRTGVLAAIYHDANHQNGPHDDVNIPAAISFYLHNSPSETSVKKSEVVQLIKTTHQENKEHIDLSEQILHDADLLQTVKGSEYENKSWREKLSAESKEPVTAVSSLEYVSSRLLTVSARESLAINLRHLPARCLSHQ